MYKELCPPKKTIADEKAEGNVSQHEGKRVVTLEATRKVATFSFSYEASQYLTNTLFIILCRNLMSQLISVAPLLYSILLRTDCKTTKAPRCPRIYKSISKACVICCTYIFHVDLQI